MAAFIITVFFMVLGLSLLLFWIKTLLEIARTEFYDNTFRVLWILGVFFFPVVGIVCWYLIGKPRVWTSHRGEYV